MTTTTQHTPGPWQVKFGNLIGNPQRPHDITAGISLIAQTFVLNGTQHKLGEGQANACLIAAAPDMLAALQLVFANAAESPEWIRSRIAPAIAKAEGK